MIIVDRIENGFAVCEIEGELVNIPKNSISGNLCEGAVLIKQNDAYIVSDSETNARKKEIFRKQRDLFGR